MQKFMWFDKVFSMKLTMKVKTGELDIKKFDNGVEAWVLTSYLY